MNDYDTHIRIDHEKLDEFEFRIRGLAKVFGYEIVDFTIAEFRYHSEEDDDPRPRMCIEFAQGEKPVVVT